MYQRACTVSLGEEVKPMLAHKRVTKVCPQLCPKSMCQGLKETMEYYRGPNGRAGVQVVDVSLVLSESGRRPESRMAKWCGQCWRPRFWGGALVESRQRPILLYLLQFCCLAL